MTLLYHISGPWSCPLLLKFILVIFFVKSSPPQLQWSFLAHIPISNHPWFFIYTSVSYLSSKHSDKMSQFIYPYTIILMSPYYLLPFQSGIWHLIWYLAFFILYLASGLWLQSGIWHPLYSICIWHPIWYLAAGIKNFLNFYFSGIKSLNYSYPCPS